MKRYYQLDTFGDGNDETVVLVEDYVKGQEMLDWRTKSGHATSDSWPEDATIVLRKSSGRKLTDLLRTITNTLYASSKLRKAFEYHCQDMAIEYLPFTLRDFRGRVIADDYSIINPLGTLDLVNTDASDIEWDDEEPDEVLLVETIVLSAEKLDKLDRIPSLFRVKEKPASYIITYDLAKEIHDGDFAGVYWDKLEVK
jgi:hypothetical protein